MKPISVYTIAMAAFLTFAIFSSYTKQPVKATTADNNIVTDKLPQVIRPVHMDQHFDFAGEALPMESFDVRERLDQELLRNAYWHSNTLLNIKKAYRFFPIIEKILQEEGVPEDLKYLAVAESDLSNAVSPAGAKGVWQFMNGTAKDYDLEINSEVDERYHLEKATRAASKYLKKYKDRFGSWTLAAAAYNMGGAGLNEEIERQRATDYYDLNLNQETSRYVFRLVAIKEILKDPANFGFYLEEVDKYSPLNEFYLVDVNESVDNWGDFAKKYGISYRMLKVYNPWLISYKLTNRSGKTYQLKIPKKLK